MTFKSTHQEALRVAHKAYFTIRPTHLHYGDEDMEAAIRAYVEARGARIVPVELADSMGCAAVSRLRVPGVAVIGAWSDMLSASPDPFAEEVTP